MNHGNHTPSRSVLLLASAALLLATACGKDSSNPAPGTGGTGGSKSGGAGGSKPNTGGSSSGGAGGGGGSSTGGSSAGGSGGAGGAGEVGGDVASEAGEVSAPGTSYVFASAGAGYGAASPITSMKLDLATGALTKGTALAGYTAAIYGAVSANKKFAYFVTEQSPATLAAFTIDAATGNLAKLNEVQTAAANGEYIGLHPGGKWLAVAHYSDGKVTVHPIADDGKVAAASDTQMAAAPMTECHQAIFDKTGANLFVTCKKIGTEIIAQYKFAAGKLTANTPPTIPAPGGVRHLAFSKDEKFAYGITEGDTSVISYSYDKATGKLTQIEKVQAYINEAAKFGGSHILIHPSGKFLFTASRFDNAILTFAIDATTGKVTKTSQATDGLSFNRNFEIDPSGTYLVAGNQANDGSKIPANKKDGGDIVVLKIDQTTGALTKVGTPVKIEAFVWYIGIVNLP